jgi:septal ring factor EnvC (AmiA/AmiB activator)
MSVVLEALEKNPETREKREEIKVIVPLPQPESSISLKISIVFAVTLSFMAVVGVIYLIQSFNVEKKNREVFEAAYVQSQEKLQMLEFEIKQQRAEADQLQNQLTAYADEKTALGKRLDEGRAEIAALQKKVEAVESINLGLKDEAQQLMDQSAPSSGAAPAES